MLKLHIKNYLDQCKAIDLAQAAILADNYLLTHKNTKSDTESSGG